MRENTTPLRSIRLTLALHGEANLFTSCADGLHVRPVLGQHVHAGSEPWPSSWCL